MRKLLAITALLTTLPCHAASVIELGGQDGGQPIDNEITVNDGRVKLLIRDANGVTEVQFHGDSRITYVINHEQRSYMALTEAGLEQMGAQLQGMMNQVQSQLSQAMQGMSEEQKAQMGSMLQNLGMAGAATPPKPPVTEYRDSGNRGNVNGFPCSVGYIYRDGVAVNQLCVATQADLDLPDGDYQTLRDAAAFGATMAEKASSLFDAAGSVVPSFDLAGMAGLPVEVRDNTSLVQVTRITRAGELPPITVPAGYTETANPLLGQ